jgi:hypothetical protein
VPSDDGALLQSGVESPKVLKKRYGGYAEREIVTSVSEAVSTV